MSSDILLHQASIIDSKGRISIPRALVSVLNLQEPLYLFDRNGGSTHGLFLSLFATHDLAEFFRINFPHLVLANKNIEEILATVMVKTKIDSAQRLTLGASISQEIQKVFIIASLEESYLNIYDETTLINRIQRFQELQKSTQSPVVRMSSQNDS